MTTPDQTYALILAGGSGERFWPLSRNTRPKQLLKLFGDDTLLDRTLHRLEGLVPPENILILTNRQQEEEVRKLASTIPAENIIAEPEKRDTAPALALGIGWVAARNPSAIMMVFPADQLIEDTAEFQKVLQEAVATASEADALVTIGIKPTWACPSYGYVERGSRAVIPGLDSSSAFEVTRFREKPDAELAETFIEKGNFSWNAGIFIWSIPTVIHELTRHCPELADFVSEVRKSADIKATIENQFPSLTKISIDYALMEKASKVLNIEATFDWDDVGSWIAVARYLEKDGHGNLANCQPSMIECSDNIVYSKDGRHIGLLGVHDLIIVQTEDAILIADRDQADNIKKLIKEVPPELL